MRSVIYKLGSFKVVKVVDEVSVTELKEDEDFMPVDLWNLSDNKEKFPTQV
jgi:hypothetical protein